MEIENKELPTFSAGEIVVYRNKKDIMNGAEFRIISDCGHYYEAVMLSNEQSYPFHKGSMIHEYLQLRNY